MNYKEERELRRILKENGYEYVRQLPDGRWVGLRQLMFTMGLFVGLTKWSYDYRYCYPLEENGAEEALQAILVWDGTGDPKGNWIKKKGDGEDVLNPRYRETA